MQLAGGLTTEADTSRAALVRVNDKRARVVVNVPLDAAPGRGELLRNGDSLRVLRLRPTLDQGVTVEGHVFQPGAAWPGTKACASPTSSARSTSSSPTRISTTC